MKFKAKHIPNALGILRVIICIALIPLMIWTPFTWYMMLLYILAGVTDMIDGPLARRIKDGKSEFGATLDSVSDMLLVVISIVLLLPAMTTINFLGAAIEGVQTIPYWMYAAFLISLGFKIISGVIGRVKFGEMVYLHTYSVKLLGFVLFIIPILYYFIFVVGGVTATAAMTVFTVYLCLVIFYIWLITTEEIIINARLKEPCRDIKSIWGIKKANERPVGSGFSPKNKRYKKLLAEGKITAKPSKVETKITETKTEPAKETAPAAKTSPPKKK